MNRRDRLLTRAITLPNGANTTNSTGVDLGESALSQFVADAEVLVTAPALTTGQLGDTQTITYSLRHSNNANLSGDVELAANLIVQTGAGGAGAAAATRRFRMPTDVRRYVFLRAVKTGASNASTASGEMAILV